MSLFDDQLGNAISQKEQDKMVLQKYKPSSSGKTLIERTGNRRDIRARMIEGRVKKIFMEKLSFFCSIYPHTNAIENKTPSYADYEKALELCIGKIEIICYNNKTYYLASRKTKDLVKKIINEKFSV